MNTKHHTPFTFLSVYIKQAGIDMIEAVAEMSALLQCREHGSVQYRLKDIEKAVATAQRSIAAYKRLVAAGRELATREEFEADPVAEASR